MKTVPVRWFRGTSAIWCAIDRLMRFYCGMSARDKLRAVQKLEAEAPLSLGVTAGRHRFGGTGFYRNDRELGHVHGNGLVDVLVGRAQRDELIATGRASLHHIFPKSGWVSFRMRDEGDVAGAIEILRLARR